MSGFRDLSKWQGTISTTAWTALAVDGVVALRAHTGFSADPVFAQSRRAAATRGLTTICYAYLTQTRPASVQAAELLDVVGNTLGPHETLCLDLEEGGGDQAGRAAAWLAVVSSHLGTRRPVLYSGDAFYAEHGLRATSSRWVRWVARYGRAPVTPHTIWQCSDHTWLPGCGYTDYSTYPGTPEQLRLLLCTAAPPPPAHPVVVHPAPTSSLEDHDMPVLVTRPGKKAAFAAVGDKHRKWITGSEYAAHYKPAPIEALPTDDPFWQRVCIGYDNQS